MSKVGNQDSQKEYNKLRQKLINEIEQGRERGFIFPEDVLPPIPKTITHHHVEQVKAIKPSTLYRNSEWVDHETGEVLAFKDISSDIYEAVGKIKGTRTKKSKSLSISTPSVNQSIDQLTDEERKQINKERGKKAWETRRANMTDEEYEEFKRIVKERFAKARKAKKVTNDYPRISMVDAVGNKLENLTQVTQPTRAGHIESFEYALTELQREYPPNIEHRKASLISFYEDIVTMNELNGTLDEYENYLIEKMSELNDLLDVIRYHSSEEEVEQSFVKIGVILNRQPLQPHEAEMFSAMAEYTETYKEY